MDLGRDLDDPRWWSAPAQVDVVDIAFAGDDAVAIVALRMDCGGARQVPQAAAGD